MRGIINKLDFTAGAEKILMLLKCNSPCLRVSAVKKDSGLRCPLFEINQKGGTKPCVRKRCSF
jgi:hypothetical protein